MKSCLVLMSLLLVGCTNIGGRELRGDGSSTALFLCGHYYLDNGARIYFVKEGASRYESDSVLIVYDERLERELLIMQQWMGVRFVVRSINPCQEGPDADRLACFQMGPDSNIAYRFVRKMTRHESCDPVSFFDAS